MNSRDYKKVILESLLKKYNNRAAKSSTVKRRVILKPSELYRAYAANNADMNEKQRLNDAAEDLKEMEAVNLDYLKFSADIERIYLREDRVEEISEFLQEEYGILSKGTVLDQLEALLKQYQCTGAGKAQSGLTLSGTLLPSYCREITARMEDPRERFDLEEIEADLKMLAFLDQNTQEIYVREASMLVYGDSKWFEANNYERICNIIRQIKGMPRAETERNDAVLALFQIFPANREIFLKGSWLIEWEGYTIDVSRLKGGVAITSADILSVKRITVQGASLMTVENKTSFQRMHLKDTAFLYLGGFAGRDQILFLKKAVADNPELRLYHFGDIDVGGFLIHRHLCREVGANFGLYRMGIAELTDKRFAGCLRKLTDNDRNRMEAFGEYDNSRQGAPRFTCRKEPYTPVLHYMKEHNVKLEQEIVSYYIEREEKEEGRACVSEGAADGGFCGGFAGNGK